MKIDGKAALVTGGAQGLGKGFTNILLRHGAKVLFTDIDQEQGETTLKEFQKDYGQGNVIFFKGDVTSDANMQDAFQKAKDNFGRLDIVVNNAGIADERDASWERCILINLTGAVLCTRLALNYMRKDRGGEGGVIINMSSVAALFPVPIMAVYAATKSALLHYSRSIAADPDVTENGVRVNVLCPAFVDTPLVQSLPSLIADSGQQMFADYKKQFGLMLVGYVAECLYELVADDSKNGAVLTMSEAKGKSYVSFPTDATA